MTRGPRTFYEFLLSRKVKAVRSLNVAAKRAKSPAQMDFEIHDAHQELQTCHREFYLVVEILEAYRFYRANKKAD